MAIGAAARLFTKTGIDLIAGEAETMANRLSSGLRERGYLINSPHGERQRGPFVNFSPGPDSPLKTITEIDTLLVDNRVSYSKRAPGVRLSPHAFNRAADVDRLLEILS